MAVSQLNFQGLNYITQKTFASSSEYIDLSGYLTSYDALVIIPCRSGTGRYSSPILLPTRWLSAQTGTLYFEVGSYATQNANSGDRLRITSSNHYLYADWSYRESSTGNLEVTVYGIKLGN